MDEKTVLLKFWKKEAPVTRKVIARIPQEKSNYKPEPKSRNAREIAWLMVAEEKILVEGLENGKIDWPVTMAEPATVKEILETYDRQHEDLMKRLHLLAGAAWEERLPFMFGDKELYQATGLHFSWEFLFDQIHHRGQLSTYLRPMGSTVPAIYGPSADEM